MDISLSAETAMLGISADHDPLTGLPTRHKLIEAIGALFAAGGSMSPALILIDLDRFKSANDGFGHVIGDALLCRVAQRLVGLTRDVSMLARIGGDGFGVLIEDSAHAIGLAERLLDFITRPYAVRGHAVTLGASIGVALAPVDGADTLTLLHSADLALHQAQQDGRGCLRRFEQGMQIRAFHRRTLEADLRTALALQQVELRRALVSKQFEVHYQPQLNLTNRRLTGFEALLRWRHPVRGLVSPAEFIPIAEEIGLIGLLGDWVLRVACRDAMQWPVPHHGGALRVAVNVSPLQLRDGGALLHAIRIAIDESRLEIGRLELEITETALVSDATDILRAIKELGCELALDDFGTGYSSLGRLRDLPFDRIKIDRSFMRDLGGGLPEDAHRSALWMVRAIASLGSGLGLATIVEGIETEQQAKLALDAGCTEMQGFLISRAMPAHLIADFITRTESTTEIPEHV